MKKIIQDLDAISSREKRCRYDDLMSSFGFSQAFYGNDLLHFRDFVNVVLKQYGLEPSCAEVSYTPFTEYVNYSVGAYKLKKFDIVCRLEPDTAVIAERAIYADKKFEQRNMERLAHVVSHALDGRRTADKYTRFFSINIADFIVWEDRPDFITRHTLKFEKLDADNYQIDDFTIELPKFKKHQEELSSELDLWVYLLKYMGDLKERPEIYESPQFIKLFDELELPR